MTESILEQAKLAYQRGDLRHALELSERGLASRAVEASPKLRYELFVLKSHCLSALGQWQEALAALKSAKEGMEVDEEAQARLAMDEGYLMGSLARYAECWTLLNHAEQTARKLNLPALLAEILWRRGIMSIFVGDHDAADKCLSSALEIASTEDNRQLQGLIRAGLAKNTMYRGQYAAAIPRFEEALAIFESLKDMFYCAFLCCELANCYLNTDEAEKALELFRKAERVFLESGCHAQLSSVFSEYWERLSLSPGISHGHLVLPARLGIGARVGRPALDGKMAPQPRSGVHEPRKSGVGPRI